VSRADPLVRLRRLTAVPVRSVGLVVALFCALCFPGAPSARGATNPTPIFSFDSAEDEPPWQVVNDGVMGGVSSSSVSVSKGVLRFSGRVSVENNGGFASVRSVAVPAAADALFADGSAVVVRLKGTASTFRLTLDTGNGWFWATIKPTGKWTTLVVPYERFTPHTRFGQPTGAAAYRGTPIQRVGLLISNGKAERFSVEVDSVSLR
jgi:NADH dehydrogenase [ubiquinone] 1 alpha subcomplex assembly factor 1